jgi:arylsulfatase
MKLTSLIFAAALQLTLHAAAVPVSAGKPNIIVILADDLGYSDLGCYGSEIATPNLDQLAAGGLRFTQFYNTAKCHSSRVSLLSGRWCRQAGDEKLSRAAIIPEVLGSAGYFTAMAGKWHLDKQPTDFGFQRYFGHLSGATNYYLGDKTLRLNGEPWAVPDKGFYTTVANVDHALTFLQEARATKKPWFLYVAFNAPHAPLQPMEADYRRYLGKYDAGWDVVRAARVAKQTELNLFGKSIDACPRPDHVPAWKDLTPEMRTWEGRRMAAYAALIDRLDQEIGRLVADLKSRGEYDNTLILFASDNGACPYDRRSTGRDREPYDPETTWSDSTGWAWARNSPFRFYKQNQFEGGISTPAIVSWPAGLKTRPGALVHSPAHLVDVLPTLAEVSGTTIPESWPGRELTSLAGISLAPIFAGNEIRTRPPIHLLFGSDRGLRDGDWKLVSFQSEPWELYHLSEDRTELHNVAAQHPDITARMVKQWHEMTQNVLMATAKEQAPVAEKATVGIRHREWTDFSALDASSARHDAEKRMKKKGAAPAATLKSIRARAETKMVIEGDQLMLTSSGNDPGLAFAHLPDLKVNGPYRLVFSLKSQSAGGGEIYWTTDAETILPKGQHQTFEVKHDGEWQNYSLTIDTRGLLHALRFDPCAAPGVVRIRGLALQDAAGKTLQSWPAAE